MRTLAIGDVHSNYIGLMQALERAEYKKLPNTRLVFLGDLFDRQPEPYEVAVLLVTLAAEHEIVWIRGNHDEWLRVYLKEGFADAGWLEHGGEATKEAMDSLKEESPVIFERFRILLDESLPYFVDYKKRLFIHGGTQHEDIGMEYYPHAYWWDRTLWKRCLYAKAMEREPLFQRPAILDKYEMIFVGHNPTVSSGSGTPIQCFNLINLDTGAGYMGYVTVMDVDTMQYWQSDSALAIYGKT